MSALMTPRPYQLECAEFCQTPPRGARGIIVSMPPGMGKSGAAILATKTRFESGQLDSCVPVITTSFARSDWKRELARWWPEAKVHALHLDDPTYRKKKTQKGKVVWQEPEEEWHARKTAGWREAFRNVDPSKPTFLISGYDGVRELYEAACSENLVFDTLIADEFHNVKRAERVTSKMIRPLIAKSRLTIGMTGTPVHNRPYDLFNQLSLLDPNRFRYFYGWAEKYFMVRVTKGGYGREVGEFQGEDGKRRLAADVAPYCFTAPSSLIAGLAKRIRYLRTVPIAETFRISPAKLNGVREGTKLDKLLRDMVRHKMKYVADLLQEELADEPVVVYAYKKEHVAQLYEKLMKDGVKCSIAMGEGHPLGSSPKKRDIIIEAWKRGEGGTRVLCCTMDAVKESATLTRAAAMVFMDLDWLPGKMMQLEGRTAPERQQDGNRRPSRYYYVVCENGPDGVVAETLIEKIEASQGIVGQKDQTMEEYKAMLQQTQEAVESVSEEQALSNVLASFEARYERMLEVGLVSSSLERD